MKVLHELWKYRDLLSMLVLRDIRIRYKQAAMGFLWAIFMPIIGGLQSSEGSPESWAV